MSEWIQKMLKPILDDEYIKGFEAGVMAQKMKDDEDHKRRLHEMYTYGYHCFWFQTTIFSRKSSKA